MDRIRVKMVDGEVIYVNAASNDEDRRWINFYTTLNVRRSRCARLAKD